MTQMTLDEMKAALKTSSDLMEGPMRAIEPDDIESLSNALASAIEQIEVEEIRTGVCEWEYDSTMEAWETGCSRVWVFIDDGPKENDCHYCMGCGGVIEIIGSNP